MQPGARSSASSQQLGLARRLVILLTLVGLVATACGNGASTAPVESAQAGAPGANAFLEGEFDTFGGPSFNLADAQNKDVVFWFWAPW